MYFRSSLRDLAEFGDFSRLWRGDGVARALQTVSALEKKAHLLKSPPVVVVSKAFLRSILQGCLRARRNLGYAMRIHSILLRNGLLFADDCLSEELIRLFAACENSLDSANRVFSTLPSPPGLYSWNAIISSHVRYGKPDLALRLYDLMACHCQIQPDKVTYVHVLRACGIIRDVRKGRLIHRDLIIRHGSQAGGDDAVVGGSILDMYAKCGAVEDAESMFDSLPERDVVAWGSMMSAMARCRDAFRAIRLLNRMRDEGKSANMTMLSSLLVLCADSRDLRHGRLVHDHVIMEGFPLREDVVLGNNLVDLYVKCGSLSEACKVFDSLPNRNSVTWTLLISGYAKQGDGGHALELYEEMVRRGDVRPDKAMLLAVLKACGDVGAMMHGMVTHAGAIIEGLDVDVSIENALLEMYAKCGNVREAQDVFARMKEHDVVSWGTMLCGFARLGDWASMASLLECMKQEAGIKPDTVIFINLLKSCCNTGLFGEGTKHFESMVRSYGIDPGAEHLSSMIDLFGRVGQLSEAKDLLVTLPNPRTSLMPQTSLLANCRTYGNVSLGGSLL